MSSIRVENLLDTSGSPIRRVAQIQFGESNAQHSTTSSSYVDINSALSLTLTPASTSSKMLLLFSTTSQVNGSRGRYTIHLSGTNSTLDGDVNALTAYEGSNINHVVAFQYVHSPNTTSAVTYKPQVQNQNGNTIFTGCGNKTMFTVMEIL